MVKRTMYQRKVDVDMLNAVKNALADILNVSPSSEQGPFYFAIRLKVLSHTFTQIPLSPSSKKIYFSWFVSRMPNVPSWLPHLSAWSAVLALLMWSQSITCTKDHRLFIFNNYPYKSMRLENPIAWEAYAKREWNAIPTFSGFTGSTGFM